MMASLTQYAQNWPFTRIFRLILGGALIASGWKHWNSPETLFGALFVFQAVMNVGCCAAGTCAPTMRSRSTQTNAGAVQIEEIK